MFVFYCTEIQGNTICLTGDDARHCAKVLRKRPGDSILLTDGCGTLAQATLTHVSPTDCVAEVAERELVPPRSISLHLAVAPTKNADRMEWLVEKAVELLRENNDACIVIAPEGTRKPVKRFKRGFYEIAVQAGVPIMLGCMDFKTKTAGYGPTIVPTGDYDADVERMLDFFRPIHAKHPEGWYFGS